MTPEQATWLAESIEDIVANPDEFVKTLDYYRDAPRYDFLHAVVEEEKKVQLAQREEAVYAWLLNNGFKTDDVAGRFIFFRFMPTVETMDHFMKHVEEKYDQLNGELYLLKMQVAQLSLRLEEKQQNCVEVRQPSSSAVSSVK